jgi:tRNA modification GTPase
VPEIAAAVLGRLPEERRAPTCPFRDERGEQIDEGIALYFAAPRSYTGESVLELQGHGGPVVLQAILAACLDAGARVAEPGEFTRRAFLEGRMDLAQAEAVADLIDAASREAARSALRSLTGEFSSAIGAVADQVVELRALTEAMLDFPEEDVDSLDRGEAVTRLDAIQQAMNDLLAKSRQGSLLRSGIHVVLAGRPNVGKSSLLNRLSGEERAIVTPIPGTTRDVLREPIQIDGVPLVLVDTAGLRASDDMVERMGMERAYKELDQADVVLAVFEVGDAAVLEQVPTGATRIDVYNKVDLVPGFRTPDGPMRAVAVSAKTGEGMAVLRKLILDAVGWASSGESTFLARERHLRAFESARAHMEAARQELGRWELFAEELRLAHVALGSVTGEFSADDLLGEIFGRFCIGK